MCQERSKHEKLVVLQITIVHNQKKNKSKAATDFRLKSFAFPIPDIESFQERDAGVEKGSADTYQQQCRIAPRPKQNLHGNLHGGGDKPFRFNVPPINTKFISSAEHWKTSTYLSFIVFLWHFWAAIKALSEDFIWIKASPDGRPWEEKMMSCRITKLLILKKKI